MFWQKVALFWWAETREAYRAGEGGGSVKLPRPWAEKHWNQSPIPIMHLQWLPSPLFIRIMPGTFLPRRLQWSWHILCGSTIWQVQDSRSLLKERSLVTWHYLTVTSTIAAICLIARDNTFQLLQALIHSTYALKPVEGHTRIIRNYDTDTS